MLEELDWLFIIFGLQKAILEAPMAIPMELYQCSRYSTKQPDIVIKEVAEEKVHLPFT